MRRTGLSGELARLPAPSEAQFQAAVIQYAELHGWTVGHFSDSRRQVRPGVFVGDRHAAGIPDLILVRESVIWAELKKTGGRLSKNQKHWIEMLKAAEQEVYCWWPLDWPVIERRLSR